MLLSQCREGGAACLHRRVFMGGYGASGATGLFLELGMIEMRSKMHAVIYIPFPKELHFHV